MKAVLMSIQPYWVFLIITKVMGWNIGREKTAEIRKNAPKDKNWNKVVKIYCSKDKKSFAKIPKEYQPLMQQFLGKVIGEFFCKDIYEVFQCNSGWVSENACLPRDKYFDYLGIERDTHFGYHKKAYAWCISGLVIYDKPKVLSEFTKPIPEIPCLLDCGMFECVKCHNKAELFKRPPQSWCYVEARQ